MLGTYDQPMQWLEQDIWDMFWQFDNFKQLWQFWQFFTILTKCYFFTIFFYNFDKFWQFLQFFDFFLTILTILLLEFSFPSVRLSVCPHFLHVIMIAWVTRPERPKVAKDKVKQNRSWGPEGVFDSHEYDGRLKMFVKQVNCSRAAICIKITVRF